MKVALFLSAALLVGCAFGGVPRPGAEIFKVVVEKILAKVTADAYDVITKRSTEALQVVAQIEATDSLIEADGKLQDIVGLGERVYRTSEKKAESLGINVDDCTQQINDLDDTVNKLHENVSNCIEARKDKSREKLDLLDVVSEHHLKDLARLREDLDKCLGEPLLPITPFICLEQVKLATIGKGLQLPILQLTLDGIVNDLKASLATFSSCLTRSDTQKFLRQARLVGSKINSCIIDKIDAASSQSTEATDSDQPEQTTAAPDNNDESEPTEETPEEIERLLKSLN